MRTKTTLPASALVAIVLVTSLACIIPTAATPTLAPIPLPPTPVPTERPEPTPTREPTPDYFATQWAGMEQEILDYLDDLELPTGNGFLGWFQEEPIEITLTGPGGRYNAFADYLVASDFVFYTEITWDTNAWPICGLIFRAGDDYADDDYYNMNFLRFSGLPAFDIEYYRRGEFFTVVTEDIRFSDYLDIEDGATNVITLAAVGNEFKIYINDHFEGRYYDYSSYLEEGKFAFVATQDSGDTTCTFADSWVWQYLP